MTNEQIATEVMGWVRDRDLGQVVWLKPESVKYWELPDFLNDHNAAIMVVEKMREDGFEVDLITKSDKQGWIAKFWKYEPNVPEVWILNDSLCHAICAAALETKGN